MIGEYVLLNGVLYIKVQKMQCWARCRRHWSADPQMVCRRSDL